ncbi:MAG: zinc-dependent metalloprotease [Bacteroidaceae bacterium]|nr:zinc-dependent metalloprotease [Bacteroidaceae bacterium]
MRNKLLLALLAFLLPISMLANVDLMNDTNHSGVRKWNKRSFTYYICNESQHLTPSERVRAINSAFATLQSKSTLSFTQVFNSNSADFIIRWVKGVHGDNRSFRWSGCERCAHVAFPEKYSCKCGNCWASTVLKPNSFPSNCLGEVHFNDDVDFEKYDMETVALHEIGHLLGLEESNDKNSIMYLGGNFREKKNLSDRDIENLALRYSFNIVGPSFENDMVSFSIPTLPQYTNVYWSTSNSEILDIWCHGYSEGSHTATFKTVGHGECYIYAKFNYTKDTYPLHFVTDSILVNSGVPDAPTITGWPRRKEFLANTRYDIYVSYPTNQQVCETEWILRENLLPVDRGNSNHIWFVTGSDGDIDLKVRVRNAHGWSEYTHVRGYVTAKSAKPGEPGKITSAPREHTMMLSSVKKVASVVKNDEYEIQLWNTNRMVRNVKSLQPSYDFDTENLSSGVYVVKVIKDGKVISSKKIIK